MVRETSRILTTIVFALGIIALTGCRESGGGDAGGEDGVADVDSSTDDSSDGAGEDSDNGADDADNGGGVDGSDGQKPASVQRPDPLYSSDSPFNVRIGSNPQIDPNSSEMIEGLVRQFDLQGFSIGVRESAIAVYEVNADTPVRDVRLAAEWTSATVFESIPVPDYAQPDPNNDREMALFDPVTRCEYDFWQVRNVDGRWVASWANSISLDGTGFFSLSPGGARAGGSGLLGGLIWPQELTDGRIDHALIFSHGETKSGGPVPPANQTDGWSDSDQAIPEGALLQLDPSFDINSLQYEFERVIALALQEYGMYLLDSTAGGLQLYAVNPLSVSAEPYELTIPEERWEEDQWVELTIPVDRFRVLEMGPQDPDPPQGLASAAGCGVHSGGGWREGVWKLFVTGEHAYLAAGVAGLQIVDVSDPADPKLVGSVGADDLEPAVSVYVSGHLAYVGTDGSGLQIIDVSDPADPQIVGSFGEDDELSIIGVEVHGDTAYAGGDASFYVLDISDPAHPQEVGGLGESERLDNVRDVTIEGNFAFVSDQVFSLMILDISDPAAPSFVSTFGEELGGDSFGLDTFVLGSVAYYGDEDVGLNLIDISDPNDQRLLGSVNLGDFAYAVFVSQGIAYVANGVGGLQIIDVADATKPTRIAQLTDIGGSARDVVVADNTAYVAARDGGLVIVDVTTPTEPRVLFAGGWQ